MNTPRKKDPVPARSNSTARPRIAAPPVYRPSATPVVLRKKSALPGKLQPTTPSNSRKTPVAPPVYRAQPATRVTQPKAAPPLAKNRTWAGTRTIQRAEAPLDPPREEPPPPPEEKADRKQKQAANMVWNEFVQITPPAPKHVLETMKLNDVGSGKLVSVVERTVMQQAVLAIGAHVKANGWKSGDGITVEWLDGEKCFKVTYKGNKWKTHVNSGQIWPYCGPDVFSPELADERPSVKDMKTLINNWKSKKQPPAKYMNINK